MNGLSQQKFADKMGVKRGKVAGYFYHSIPKLDFQKEFEEKFNVNLGLFLTERMNNDNYQSFFKTKLKEFTTENAVVDTNKYVNKSNVIDMLILVKNELDSLERSKLIDEVIKSYGKVLEENGLLRGEISKYQAFLLKQMGKI